MKKGKNSKMGNQIYFKIAGKTICNQRISEVQAKPCTEKGTKDIQVIPKVEMMCLKP
jgi:hypothetical protein